MADVNIEDLARENSYEVRRFLEKFVSFVNKEFQYVEPLRDKHIRAFLKAIS